MMRFVTLANGLTLHYAQEGITEGASLIFIHALGTDLRVWDDVVTHFADAFPSLRYDLRGHGLSDCPHGPYTIQDEVGDLAGLLDALKIKAAILVGISVGGLIAMGCAAAFPERVRALVLSNTGIRIGSEPYWNERINTLHMHGMDYLAESILARWFAPDFAGRCPAEYRGYRHLLARTPLSGYMATCAAIRDADMGEAARAIRVPTLVLGGAQDVSTPPDLGRALAEAIPGARFALIDQAGHLPCVEQSDRYAARIKTFVEEIRYARR